jgi:hypothetical protein
VVAQGDAVFEVKAKAVDTVAIGKHRSVVLPPFDTAGLNFVVIDSTIDEGDTIKFTNPDIVLGRAYIQTGQGPALKQHRLFGNIIDDYTAYLFRYGRKYKQTPLIIIQAVYSNGSIREREQMYYQVKFLP